MSSVWPKRHPNRRTHSDPGKKKIAGNGASPPRVRDAAPPHRITPVIAGGSYELGVQPASTPEPQLEPTPVPGIEPPTKSAAPAPPPPVRRRPYTPCFTSTGVVTYSEGGRGL